MSIDSLLVPPSDAELVQAVAALDPRLAHEVQQRIRVLRLRIIISQGQAAQPLVTRHSIWHSLRWPWRPRGQS